VRQTQPQPRSISPEPYHRIAETAAHFAVSRQTILRLVDEEGLPAHAITSSARTIAVLGRKRANYRRRGQRTLLFKLSEVEAWLAGRRQRQIRANISGERYARRGTAQ
jgi:predicted DNA-binding transcriptional regulator AlpA